MPATHARTTRAATLDDMKLTIITCLLLAGAVLLLAARLILSGGKKTLGGHHACATHRKNSAMKNVSQHKDHTI